MEIRNEHTIYTFSEINPAKKYSSFSYFDALSVEDFRLYMELNMIVLFDGKYYQFKGAKTTEVIGKKSPVIQIKSGKAIIYTIPQ